MLDRHENWEPSALRSLFARQSLVTSDDLNFDSGLFDGLNLFLRSLKIVRLGLRNKIRICLVYTLMSIFI